MALPPVPLQDIKGLPYTFQEWLRQLRQQVSGIVSWSSVDKAGSNLTDIVTRNHSDLQNISGGSVSTGYQHLKRALTGTKTTDFGGTISANSVLTTTTTVTGATSGDKVVVSPTSQLNGTLSLYAYVSAADTVTIVLVNQSASSQGVGSKTYNVLVLEN